MGHRPIVIAGGKFLLPAHAVALGHPDRGQVVRLDDGADLLGPQHPKGVIPAGLGGLAGVALVPEALFQKIAHLQHGLALTVLPGDARLAHHLPGGAQHHRPQPKAVPAVALPLAGQPLCHIPVREAVLVGRHHFRVLQDLLQVRQIPLCHLPQQQPPGAQNLLHGASKKSRLFHPNQWDGKARGTTQITPGSRQRSLFSR